MIAFYVQGGGLGHLTRIHKLIKYLNIKPEKVLIISPSKFSHYFEQYTFCRLKWNESADSWSDTVLLLFAKHHIDCCYIDAFPLGIKGELLPIFKHKPEIQFIYVCRLLKWETYQLAIPEVYSPHFKKVLVLEKLYKNHYSWVQETTADIDFIALPAIVSENHIRLANNEYGILVHSGGKKDVHYICTKIQEDLKDSKMPIFVFTQVALDFKDPRFHFRIAQYPVYQYFKWAKKIYTAAGFNLINELQPYHKKHYIFPIERHFDDQSFRAKNKGTFLIK